MSSSCSPLDCAPLHLDHSLEVLCVNLCQTDLHWIMGVGSLGKNSSFQLKSLQCPTLKGTHLGSVQQSKFNIPRLSFRYLVSFILTLVTLAIRLSSHMKVVINLISQPGVFQTSYESIQGEDVVLAAFDQSQTWISLLADEQLILKRKVKLSIYLLPLIQIRVRGSVADSVYSISYRSDYPGKTWTAL